MPQTSPMVWVFLLVVLSLSFLLYLVVVYGVKPFAVKFMRSSGGTHVLTWKW